MAYRSMNLATRGIGLFARRFQAISERAVASVSFDARTASSLYTVDSPKSSIFQNTIIGTSCSGCSLCGIHYRSYASSVPTNKEYAPNPLDAFRDPVDRQTRMEEKVGRQWSVKELRRKSYEDLHRLWYVLYKEKNMLLTEQQLSRRRQLIFPQPDRFRKVRKSMGAIRQVLGERKREKVAAHLERHQEKELAKQMTAELDTADFEEIDEDIEDSSDNDTNTK